MKIILRFGFFKKNRMSSTVLVHVSKTLIVKGNLGQYKIATGKEAAGKRKHFVYENKKIMDVSYEKVTETEQVERLCEGVSQGYTANLRIHGMGYQAKLNGDELELEIGLSHKPIYKIPRKYVTCKLRDATNISIAGISKAKVNQVAAEIIRYKPPQVYKDKGIRYEGGVE